MSSLCVLVLVCFCFRAVFTPHVLGIIRWEFRVELELLWKTVVFTAVHFELMFLEKVFLALDFVASFRALFCCFCVFKTTFFSRSAFFCRVMILRWGQRFLPKRVACDVFCNRISRLVLVLVRCDKVLVNRSLAWALCSSAAGISGRTARDDINSWIISWLLTVLKCSLYSFPCESARVCFGTWLCSCEAPKCKCQL